MNVEIDFESVQKLNNGDCVEINGVVGENKLAITFLVLEKPIFQCCLDHTFGWDVYVIDNAVKDIQSGTVFTSLGFCPDSQFSISFHILTDEISIFLNERELCCATLIASVTEITSIRITGDSSLKHILFSDFSSKSSRVLQPVIYESLESKDQSITVIESRRRIVFKSNNDQHDGVFTSDIDSDSDQEIFETNDMHSDFDYLKKVLMSRSTSDHEEVPAHHQTEVPSNRYVISYFDPDLIDCGARKRCEDVNSKHQFFDMINSSMIESSTRINTLKTNTERIVQSIENTGRDIAEIRHSSQPVTTDETRRMKSTKMLSIPISEVDGSYVKYNLTMGLSKASKIPVLKKQIIEPDKTTYSVPNKTTHTKCPNTSGKPWSERKPLSSSRRRRQNVVRS